MRKVKEQEKELFFIISIEDILEKAGGLRGVKANAKDADEAYQYLVDIQNQFIKELSKEYDEIDELPSGDIMDWANDHHFDQPSYIKKLLRKNPSFMKVIKKHYDEWKKSNYQPTVGYKFGKELEDAYYKEFKEIPFDGAQYGLYVLEDYGNGKLKEAIAKGAKELLQYFKLMNFIQFNSKTIVKDFDEKKLREGAVLFGGIELSTGGYLDITIGIDRRGVIEEYAKNITVTNIEKAIEEVEYYTRELESIRSLQDIESFLVQNNFEKVWRENIKLKRKKVEGIYKDKMYGTDVDIFLQRNIDRMDPDTLVGVLMDKFDFGHDTAEEIVIEYMNEKGMREAKSDKKFKGSIKESIQKENTITLTKSIKVGNVILEKGDKIKVLSEKEYGTNLAKSFSEFVKEEFSPGDDGQKTWFSLSFDVVPVKRPDAPEIESKSGIWPIDHGNFILVKLKESQVGYASSDHWIPLTDPDLKQGFIAIKFFYNVMEQNLQLEADDGYYFLTMEEYNRYMGMFAKYDIRTGDNKFSSAWINGSFTKLSEKDLNNLERDLKNFK